MLHLEISLVQSTISKIQSNLESRDMKMDAIDHGKIPHSCEHGSKSNALKIMQLDKTLTWLTHAN